MNVPDRIPLIEDLIPHRGTMLLLDRVAEFNDEMALAEYMPRNPAWYIDDNGKMPAWIGIELMAQTVAAHVSLMKRKEGIPFRMGVLLGTRSYQSSTSAFEADRNLRIVARMILRDPSGLGAFDCSIGLEDRILATSTLKVYEPEDFDTFVQGNAS